MPDALLGDLRLHYEKSGSDGAPWLVLSGSVATDLHMWDALAARLGGAYRILRYDQRGHGGSSSDDTRLTFSLLAGDLAALMDDRGATSAIVVGASMGGTTALVLAAERPDLVSRLVVAGSRPASTPASEAYWAAQSEILRRQGAGEIASRIVERWFTPASVAASTEAVRTIRATVERMSPSVLQAAFALLGAYDIRDALPQVRCPVLLAYGDHDPVPREAVDELAGLLPDVAFETIPDAGHLPAMERPDRFAEAARLDRAWTEAG
ncbi:MAG: alpha/beta fold hydrolase [Microbacterium sp.]|nr:alpha/beta fold hydrolase [Microbacterium sp.]